MTIQGRLLLLAASIVLPFVLFAVFGAMEHRREAEERAQVEAGREAMRIARQFERHVERIRAMMPAVEAAVGDNLADEARNDSRLKHIMSGSPGEITGIGVLSPDGRPLAVTSGDPRVRATVRFADRDYFRAALQTRAFSIGAPVRGRLGTEDWILPAAQPMLDAGGEVLAVIGISTQLRSLQRILSAQTLAPEALVTLAADGGPVLAHFPRGDAAWGRPAALDDVPRFGATEPVKGTPWTVYYGLPVKVALAPVNEESRNYSFVALLMVAAAILAALPLARGLVRPIRQLQNGANLFAQGVLDRRIEAGGGELGELAVAFNRMGEGLQAAEARLRNVVDAVPAMIVRVDPGFRLLTVNRAFLQLSGAGPRQAPGWTVQDAVGRAAFERIRPHMALALGGRTVVFQESFRLADGTQREFRIQYVPERDAAGAITGVVGLGIDVTEELAAQRALAEQEMRFRSVFETAQEGIAIHRDGTIVQANAALARLVGAADAASLAGMQVSELVTPEFREAVRRRTGILGGGEATMPYVERRLQRMDGGVREVEMGGGAYVENGVRYLTLVVRDLSERKAHELRILELNEDLERRVEARTAELTVAYREMEAFSYSVSHDLRAPLRAASGLANIVLQDYGGAIPDKAAHMLRRIAHNAERMGALIEGLLELGRLSRQTLVRQKVSPAELAREVLGELAALREGYSIDFRIGDMPACSADRVLLKQVYANLLGNAIKYSGRRADAKVEAGAITLGEGPVYYVRDNGAGFDMAYADKLFGVFSRLHSESEFEGTGIGLALVRRIVERHGGKVWADSAPGKGATFFFRLGAEVTAASAGDQDRGRTAA